jgi:hypothetical protein
VTLPDLPMGIILSYLVALKDKYKLLLLCQALRFRLSWLRPIVVNSLRLPHWAYGLDSDYLATLPPKMIDEEVRVMRSSYFQSARHTPLRIYLDPAWKSKTCTLIIANAMGSISSFTCSIRDRRTRRNGDPGYFSEKQDSPLPPPSEEQPVVAVFGR